MEFSLLMLLVISSGKLVEYRLGVNYGKVLVDYSGNNNHGVNGDSHLTTSKETILTDRGAYFAESSVAITVPKNTLVTTDMTLSSTFTILCWFLPQDKDGILLYRYKSVDSSNNYLTVSREDKDDKLILFGKVSGSYKIDTGGKNSFRRDRWNMISIVATGATIKGYYNGEEKVSVTFPTAYSETGSYLMTIGSTISNAVKGILWYFVILNNDSTSQSSYYSGSSSACLTSSCVTCDPSINDPYLGIGCVSKEIDPYRDSNSGDCIGSTYGCSTSGSLDCSGCTCGSCIQSGSTNNCWCPSGCIASTYSCYCPSGAVAGWTQCCDSSCKTCSSSSSTTCLTCLANNAIPDGTTGCKCSDGYYGTKPLYTTNACTACNSECATCNQANVCLTCKSTNASPDATAGCNCNSGYYSVGSQTGTNSCIACNSECSTCTAANLCTTCKSTNATPDSTAGCNCNIGYYSVGSQTSANSCIACNNECTACTEANKCTTCISSNASPDATIGCNCNSGFYSSTGSETSANSCVACYSECATCTEANKCTTCKSTNASPDSTIGCNCNSGYYSLGSETAANSCLSCNSECATCTQANICVTCKSSNASPDSTTGCNCNDGYYSVGSLTAANSCIACNNECSTCTQANICTACISSNASPDSTSGCNCNNGYYSVGSQTAANSCLTCSSECATCSEVNKCLTCISSNASPDATAGCICNAGYYSTGSETSAGSCLNCNSECETCTEASKCVTCKSSNANPDSITGCNCNAGYYSTGSETTANSCIPCNSECQTCTVANLCTTCKSSNASPDSTSGCNCNIGYYSLGSQTSDNSCISCYSECSACTEADKCTTCKSLNASPDLTIGCKCDNSYYSTGPETAVNSCLSCNNECLTCTEANKCATCISSNASPDSTLGCNCNVGYYSTGSETSANSCIACYAECASCTQANICVTCKSSDATPDSSIGCNCNTGFYSVGSKTSANSCIACNTECATCTEANKCATCKSLNASPDLTTGCNCNDGYYSVGSQTDVNSCLACNNECTTCDEANKCTTCKSSNASPDPSIGCNCDNGYYSTGSEIVCIECYEECKTCKSALECLICKDPNAYPDSNLGCMCKSEFFNTSSLLTSGICISCYSECSSCEDIKKCLSCKDPNARPSLSIGCECNDNYYNTTSLSIAGSCLPCYTEDSELTVQINSSESILTAFFDTTIKFLIVDQNNFCTNIFTLVINIPDSSYNKLSEYIETGEISIPVYFLVSGDKQVTALTLGYSAQYTINVRKPILKLIECPTAFTLSEVLTIKISVFDYLGENQEISKGPHTINLNIKDSLKFELNLSSSTIFGTVKFENIVLATNQNVSVIASANDMETVSGTIEYEAPPIIILELLSPDQDLFSKVLYNFQVSVSRKLSKSVELIIGGNVSFYIYNQAYSKNLTDLEGVSMFNLVFNVSGIYSLSFEYNSVILYKEFNVSSNENTDQLCYISVEINNCKECVENAHAINGICQCFTGSSFNATTRVCECPSGQKLKKYSCVSCGTYFKASEIASEFDKDYKSLFVYFDRPVVIRDLKNCNNILLGPTDLLNISKECLWISLKILKIKLSEYPIIQNPQIILNNLKVQALETICYYNKEDLIIQIEMNYEPPQPSAEIYAPDYYSITCSKQSLQISASFKSQVASYTWKSSIQPFNDKISELISSSISDTIEIAKSLLTVSVIQVELTVRYNNLNTWAKSSKKIVIENKDYLIVDLNVKSFFQIKRNQAVYLVAKVKQACGKIENFTYKWTSTEMNLDEYFRSDRKDVLQIPGGILESGKQYTFQVDVNEGLATGKASTMIEVISSGLVITLTRSSGEITTKKDFSVGCTVEDPDNKDLKILTEWYCVESTGACTDSKGKLLSIASEECNLLISKELLRSRATYILTVKASTSQKFSYSTIEVTVNPNIEGVSEVSFPSIKINSDYINNLIPKIAYSGFLTFSWKISGGEYSKDSLILTNSFIGIPEYTLKQGNNYRLELDITSDQFKETLKIYGQLSSNLGPICEGLKYEEGESGTVLLAEDCIDGDDEDYPLMYQFGYSDKKDKVRWLNEPFGINKFTENLPLNAVKAYVRVFDNFETSSTYSTEITHKLRHLQDYLLQIMQKLRNPSNVPSTIMEYKDLKLDYASFNYLYSSYYSYFITFPSSKSNLELFIDSLEGILAHKEWISDEVLNNSTNIAIHIIEGLNQRLLPDICEKQFLAFKEYLTRIDKELLIKLLVLVGEKLVYDTVPNSVYSYSDFFSFIKLRKIAKSYLGSQVSEGNLTVEFPKNFEIDETYVFDTFFSLQNTEDSFIINFLSNSTGKYENYTLDIFNNEYYGMDVKNPLVFTIINTFNYNDAICKNSITNDSSYCQIDKVNNTHIVLRLYTQGSYTIEKGLSNCSLTRAPISISAALFGIFICLGILFLVRDKSTVPAPRETFSFQVLYNLTSIFISQRHPNRTCSVLRISSKLLFILALIGATYTSDIQNQFYSQFTFLEFYQLGRGLLALAASQILTIFINLFIIIGKKKESKCLKYSEILVLIIVSILSILAISLVCVLVCPEDVTDWLINFAIMGTVEIIILELIVAKIISRACKIKGKDKDKNMATIVPLGKNISISDRLSLNESWHFSPRALKSTIANESYA